MKKPTPKSALERLGPTVESLGLKRTAFPLAPGSSIRAIVLRELTGHDDDDVADSVSIPADASPQQAGRAMIKEAMRRAIVGFWPVGRGDFVDAQQPFDGMRGWNIKTQRQVQQFFHMVNGADEVDLKKAADAAIGWQPGDGAPSWPADSDSADSTGDEPSRNDSSESGPG